LSFFEKQKLRKERGLGPWEGEEDGRQDSKEIRKGRRGEG
jgi:hypothetical protein